MKPGHENTDYFLPLIDLNICIKRKKIPKEKNIDKSTPSI